MDDQQKPQLAPKEKKKESSDTAPNRQVTRTKSYWLGHDPADNDLTRQVRGRRSRSNGSTESDGVIDRPEADREAISSTPILGFDPRSVDPTPAARPAQMPARTAMHTGGSSIRRVQPKLRINMPGDRHEQEADRVADEVVSRLEAKPQTSANISATTSTTNKTISAKDSGPQAPAPAAPAAVTPVQVQARVSAPPSGNNASVGREAPPSVDRALNAPGQALPEGTREQMEEAFGEDFGDVRVYTGAAAAGSSDDIGARAFTVGRAIVFGNGEFRPGTAEGNRLLAHELAHVVQQGGSSQLVQMKDEPKTGVKYPFRVKLRKELKEVKGNQLMLELIKQYYGLKDDDDTGAQRILEREEWAWMDGTGRSTDELGQPIPPPVVTQVHLDQGYIDISLTDRSVRVGTKTEKKAYDKYFEALSPDRRSSFNAKAERDLRKRTRYGTEPNQGTKAGDTMIAEYRRALRDDLLRKQQAIDALPPQVRNLLFGRTKTETIDPSDLDTVLRIAAMLENLSPLELEEYGSRTTDSTLDWRKIEEAVRAFVKERQERQASVSEMREIETRLYGLDEIYDEYCRYRLASAPTTVNLPEPTGMSSGTTIGKQPELRDSEKILTAKLIDAGFTGINDFEDTIKKYEAAFEHETIALAYLMLDKFEHKLLMEEERYSDPKEVTSLFTSVEKTGARAQYMRAKEAGTDPPSSAKAAMRTVGAKHELLADESFDHQELAMADEEQISGIMHRYIIGRQSYIIKARKAITEKPKRIYGLDILLKTSILVQDIKEGSIYHKIIQNHIKDVKWTEVIEDVIVTIFAIAAGTLTGGSGAVAVLASGVGFGISAYQAVQEFRRYEIQQVAKGAKLASDDPSMFWVIVSVIGAGLDMAAFVKALPKLRPAIEAFNVGEEAGDLAMLTQKLRVLQQEGGVPADLINSILKGAERQMEATAAWDTFLRPSGNLYSLIVPGAERVNLLFHAVYLSFKRGVQKFETFLASREFLKIVGNAEKLTAKELAMLKVAFRKAVKEIDEIATYGKSLGMVDEEIRPFMNARGMTDGMTVEQVKQGMETWRKSATSITDPRREKLINDYKNVDLIESAMQTAGGNAGRAKQIITQTQGLDETTEALLEHHGFTKYDSGLNTATREAPPARYSNYEGDTISMNSNGEWEYHRTGAKTATEHEVGRYGQQTADYKTGDFFQSHHVIQDKVAETLLSKVPAEALKDPKLVYRQADGVTVLLRDSVKGSPHRLVTNNQLGRRALSKLKSYTFEAEYKAMLKDLEIAGVPAQTQRVILAEVHSYFGTLYDNFKDVALRDAIFGGWIPR